MACLAKTRRFPDVSALLGFGLALLLHCAGQAAVTRGPYLQCGSPTGMVVRWRTDVPTTGRLNYGVNPAALTRFATGAAPTSEHQITLTGLEPDTRYFYSVADGENLLASGSGFYFVTSPARARPVRLWVVGDSQYGGADGRAVRDAYVNLAGTNHTDAWLTLGDLALYTGTDEELQEYFFDVYPEVMRHAVMWPTIGNHDAALSLEDFPYLHTFTVPTRGESGGVPSGTPRYYSFDYGNLHCVSLDSITLDLTANGAMYRWLEQDLTVNTQKWLIVFFHVPPYSKGSHDSDAEYATTMMREVFVPLLEHHGVDLVLTGHSHTYERSYLLDGHYGYSWTFQPGMILNAGDGRSAGGGPYVKGSSGPTPHQGTVYVEAGTGSQARYGPLNHPAMCYSSVSLGSLVIDIDDNTLHCRFLRDSGAIDDEFTLIKGVRACDFRVTARLLPQAAVELTWGSVTGQVFQVSRREKLDAPWVRVAESILATNSTTRWRDPATSTAGAFYRVEN